MKKLYNYYLTVEIRVGVRGLQVPYWNFKACDYLAFVKYSLQPTSTKIHLFNCTQTGQIAYNMLIWREKLRSPQKFPDGRVLCLRACRKAARFH